MRDIGSVWFEGYEVTRKGKPGMQRNGFSLHTWSTYFILQRVELLFYRQYLHVFYRAVVAVSILVDDFFNHIQTFFHTTEHGVLPIEEGRAANCGVGFHLFGRE